MFFKCCQIPYAIITTEKQNLETQPQKKEIKKMTTTATLIGYRNGLVKRSQVQAETLFLIRRKEWARDLFQDSEQPWEPGREVKGTFEGIPYTITIGPRLGVNISGQIPATINSQGIPYWVDGDGNSHIGIKPELRETAKI